RAELRYIVAHVRDGVCTDACGVGTHVGDETYGAFAAELNALIQALCNAHRAADIEAEANCGVLLEPAGGVGSARVAPALFLLDGADAPLRGVEVADDVVRGLLVRQSVGDELRLTFHVGTVGHA